MGTGKWAHVVDLHEELTVIGKKDIAALDEEFRDQPARRAQQQCAVRAKRLLLGLCKTTHTDVTPKAGLLTLLGKLLTDLYAAHLDVTYTQGMSKRGTRCNYIVKSLKMRIPMASVLPCWHVKLSTLSFPDAEENEYVAAGIARRKASERGREPVAARVDQGAGPSQSGQSVANLCDPDPPQSDCQWRVKIDCERASAMVERLSGAPLTVEGTKVRDELACALAAADDGVLQQAAVREREVGARVPNRGSLLTMSPTAADVLVGRTHEELRVTDSARPGCLPLTLILAEARELQVDTPEIDRLVAKVSDMQAMQARRPEGERWWFTSDDTSHTIRGLQRTGERPCDALRRAVRAVYQLVDSGQGERLRALLKEATAVARAAMGSERWKHLRSIMANECRGSHGKNVEEHRQRVLAGVWTALCDTLVDRHLGDVERQLGQTRRSVAGVDGRDPGWIKVLVTKSDARLPAGLCVKALGVDDSAVLTQCSRAAPNHTALRAHVAAVVRAGNHDELSVKGVRAAVEERAGLEPGALHPRRKEIGAIVDEELGVMRSDADRGGDFGGDGEPSRKVRRIASTAEDKCLDVVDDGAASRRSARKRTLSVVSDTDDTEPASSKRIQLSDSDE
jgi:hypothetical protein